MIEEIKSQLGESVLSGGALLTADTGYSNEHGRQVSFIVVDISYLDLMKKKIDSAVGKKDYAKRMWTIEPVFGNITSNKRLNKLGLRGKAKVTCQWMMFCMVHNIEKLWRYGDVKYGERVI
jgi:hypothetical protein